MNGINFCHHIPHPFSQGKARLSAKEKKIAKLTLLLLPVFGIGGVLFYGVTLYFKNKAIKNLTKTPPPKPAKVFKKKIPAKKSPVLPKKNLTTNLSKSVSEKSVSLGFPKLQANEFAIDYSFKNFASCAAAAREVLKTRFHAEKSYPEYPTPTIHSIGTNSRFRLVRCASKQFVDSFNPKVLKAQRHIDENNYLYLQMKRIGHVFDLRGRIELPYGNLGFSGFNGELALPLIAASFSAFYKELDKSNLPADIEWLTPVGYKWIQDNLKEFISSALINKQDIKTITNMLQDPDFKGPIATGSGFDKHYTVAGFLGDIAFLINRGYGSSQSGISLYKIKNRALLTEASITDIFLPEKVQKDSFFGHGAMQGEIGGEFLTTLRLPSQKSGSCSYKSTEGYLCLLLMIQYLYNRDPFDFYKNLSDKDIMQTAFKAVKPAFERWIHFDRKHVYLDLMRDFERVQSKPANDKERIMYQEASDMVSKTKAFEEMILRSDY